MKNPKMILALKALKNSLDGESAELARALQSAIEEAENSESEVTIEELIEKIKPLLVAQKEEAEAAAEVVIENKVRERVSKELLEIRNDFGKKSKANTYLSSPQAIKDFANTVRNSKDGAEQRVKWQAKLVENGLTGLVYPTELMAGIQTSWAENSGLMGAIRKISNKAIKIPYTVADKDTLANRARGHKKGETKIPQNLALLNKQLNLQAIYKDLPLDRIDLASIDDDNALIAWVIEELAMFLTYECERAILIGDGRTAGNDKITSIEAIGDKTATDAFTVVSTLTASTDLIVDVKKLVDSIESKGLPIWLYTSKSNRSKLQEFKAGTGATTQFLGLDILADQLGVDEIKTFTMPEGVEAIVMVPQLYFRNGGEPFGESWTIYEKNQEAFRSEVFMGGGIGGVLSTGVLRTS